MSAEKNIFDKTQPGGQKKSSNKKHYASQNIEEFDQTNNVRPT